MAIFKCKMCGGTLEIEDGQTVATCEFCGTKQTVPTFDSEKKATFFNRANALRLKCEFDKAAGVYETIISEFPNDSEAYWGLVLCKFGIEYVDDPKTGNKIPTCHRTQFTSIFDDHDYKACVKNADVVAAEVYKSEAQIISSLQKKILEISSKEDPFDVFICYKETDKNGERTKDSVLAQEIYNDLTNEGFKVFFARLTLEHKLGSAYEPYIFAALHSSKVMLHVTTSLENSDSVWVKNEWARYLGLIADGDKKVLIPCYRDITAYDLPDDLQNLQGQDMGKIGAMQDLVYGVKKIIKPTSIRTEAVHASENATGSDFDAFIRKGYTYLKNHKMEQADRCFEQAIEATELCGEGYLGKLLCEFQLESLDELLLQTDQDILSSENFKLAREFASKSCKNTLDKIEDAIQRNPLVNTYNKACQLMKEKTTDCLNKAISYFEELGSFEDSEKFIQECLYLIAINYLTEANSIDDLFLLDNAINTLNNLVSYKDSRNKASECADKKAKIVLDYNEKCLRESSIKYPDKVTIESLNQFVYEIRNKKNQFYSNKPLFDEAKNKFEEEINSAENYLVKSASSLIDGCKSVSDVSAIVSLLNSCIKITPEKKLIDLCNEKIKQIKDELSRLKKQKRIKTFKISSVVCGSLAALIGISFGIKAIVEETNRSNTYKAAIAFMESGDYDSAIRYYESLENYHDSVAKINVCKGMKELETSIATGSEKDAVAGIKTIVNAGEKVDVTYTSKGNHTVRKLYRSGGDFSDSYTETIDNPNFTLYQPGINNGYTFVNWNSIAASYTNNRASLTLNSNWSINTYSISYVLNGGINDSTNPTQYTVESENISLGKASRTNYQFLGWFTSETGGNKIDTIEKGSYGNLTLYARWEINHYTVKFYNGSELLESVQVDHGGTAKYTKQTPTKPADAQYTYSFCGWDKILTNITSNFSTYAQFTNKLNSYAVTFYNWDGKTVLETKSVNYGECASYTKSTPTRDTDDNYEYSFSGWDKPLTTVITGTTSFVAQYNKTERYLCSFYNDKTLLFEERVTKGNNAEYKGETPTKPADSQYSYTFSSWDKSLNNIQANTNFYAQFSSSINSYLVRFLNYDNSVLNSSYVEYGKCASYKGSTPTRAKDNYYAYTFSGWDKPLTTIITSNTDFKAQYSTTDRYLCTFNNYDNSFLYSCYVTKGESACYSGSTPTKPKTQQYTYVFSSWDKPLINITQNTIFTAQYNNVTNKYTVSFVNYDGSALGSSTVDYGTKATYSGSTPTKPIENRIEYTFSGWDISLENITHNVTATAQYSTTDRYLCTFNNYDNSLLYSCYVTKGKTAVFTGTTPTKPKTQQYSYVFKAWDKLLTNISEDSIFTAQFDSIINKYSVTFVNYDGSTLGISTQDYNTDAVYTGSTPLKPDYHGCSFAFNGWDISLKNIKDNVTATAQYTQLVNDIVYELNTDENEYIIKKYNGDAEELDLVSTYNNLPVVEIGESAFESSKVKKILIPNTITTIGTRAFANSSLQKVNFETTSALTTIKSKAFSECKSLLNTYDAQNAGGEYLTGIVIPKSVTSISSDAFYYYYNIGTNWNYSQKKYLYCEECNFMSGYSQNSFGTWQVYGRPGASYTTYTYSYTIFVYAETEIDNPYNYGFFKYDSSGGIVPWKYPS